MAGHPMIILLLAVCLFLGSSDGRTSHKKVPNVRKLKDTVRKTNPEDGKGIDALVLQFQALNDGANHSCHPPQCSWINCTTDASPRVRALYLRNLNLLGFLPDFSTMDALETIEMDHNLLTGSIPSFLGTLPNLKELNLANNLFSGQVPASILQNKKLKTDFSGNPALLYQIPASFNLSGSGGADLGGTPKAGADLGGTPEATIEKNISKVKLITKLKLSLKIGGGVSAVVIFSVAVVIGVRCRLKATQAVAPAAAAGQNAGANEAREMTEETPIYAQPGSTNS